jgi:hypothetical protein
VGEKNSLGKNKIGTGLVKTGLQEGNAEEENCMGLQSFTPQGRGQASTGSTWGLA